MLQELEDEVDRLEAKKTVITGKMYRNLKRENGRLKQQLEEIYEALVGDNGMERFTHAELIDWAHQLVDKEEEI